MKRLILLLSLILTAVGLSAQTISMTTANGSLSSDNKTWTSNAASGIAGVTVSTTNATCMEASGDYYFLTPKSNTTAYTYTITAPSGYVLTGYSITFINNRAGNTYYVYLRKGATAPTKSTYDGRATKTNPATVTVTGNMSNTLQFTVMNGNSQTTQRLLVTDFTITVEKQASAGVEWSAASDEESTDDVTHSFPTLVNPNGLTVTYSSSNEDAATIDPATGEISLWGPGVTTITASWDKQIVGSKEYPAGTASYELTVTGPYVASLGWSAPSAKMRSTSTSGFPTLVNPDGLSVTYSSSKENIATIDGSGNITMLASGTTVITANATAQTVGGKSFTAVSASYELSVLKIDDPTTAETATGLLYPSFSSWDYVKILNVFYNANKAGRYYPTEAEWTAAGFNMEDVAFMRSHVRKHSRITSTATDHKVTDDSYWKTNRQFYAHFSNGSGYNGTISYPSTSFSEDNFSMWNYVDLIDNFNHSIGHVSGAWVDAAHKNGSSILGGGLLLESADQYNSYVSGVRAKDSSEPSGFKYVRAMVSMLMYFGQDGFHITSWMDWNYDEDDQRAYMKALYDEAAARGFAGNFRLGMQAMKSSYASDSKYAEWGTKGDGYISDVALHWQGAGQVFSSNIAEAQENFKAQVGDEYANRIYAAGNFSTWAQPWNVFQNNDAGIALWGERAASRFWSNATGANSVALQENYLLLQERGFSGGNRNPNETPAVYVGDDSPNWGNQLANFHGIASFMTERSSVIGDLPFATNFQVGNGEFYHYKGKKTGGEWYNMSNQDIVPTYRWLVVNDASASTKVTNTSIVPRFSWDDSYTGGSMLKITGAGTTAGDVVLYKSQLNVSKGNVIAKVAVKTPDAAGATNLQLKLQVDGVWKAYNVGSTNGTAWEEKTINLSDISVGSVIENIALRLTSVSASTKLYVGMIEINDDVRQTPATPTNVQVKIYDEKAGNMTIKAWWDVNKAANEYGQSFNDDLNIDHFEVLFKPYDAGDVVEVARTSQWAALAPSVVLDKIDDPWIGIRAVSTDLKTYSDVVWTHVGHNQDATGSDYGDGYGFPILGSYGNGSEATQKAFFKMNQAYTMGAAVQDLNYDITGFDPDPYVGRDGCPALVPAVGQSILIDIASYDYADDLCIIANPGDDIDFYFTHDDSSGGSLSYGLLSVFADWYRVGSFVDEPIFTSSQRESKQDNPPYYRSGLDTSGCERLVSFTVPADAAPGKSRLRFVFNDAWSTQPAATSPLTKGVAFDFPIEVTDIGQVVGESPSEQGKDKGEASQPAGLPGSALSTWGDLQDGGVYYLTSDNGNGEIQFLYNNGSGLSSSSGVVKSERANFMDGADYSYKFVAHKTDDNNFVLVNGHGGYFNVQSITDDFGTTVAVTDAVTPATASDPMLNFAAASQNEMLQVRSANYPNKVVVRPTSCANFDGETDNIALATWSAPFETILPEGLKAYTIEAAFDKNDQSYAAIVPVEVSQGGVDIIPANVGVLLVSTGVAVPESGLTFLMAPAASSGAVDPSSVNYLMSFTTKDYDKGTNRLTAGGRYYILAATDGTAATRKLYQVNTSKQENLTPNPNKSVLDANSFALSAPGLSLVWDTTKTAVGKVVLDDDASAPAYDLQGRRINGNYKGIFIKNGKKIVKF